MDNKKLKKILTSPETIKEITVGGAFLGFGYMLMPEIITGIIKNNLPFIIGGGMVSISALGMLLNKDTSIEKKIDQVFKNIGLCVKGENDEKMYPELIKKFKTYYGEKLIYSLPPGITDYDIIEKSREIQIAINGETEIWEQNGNLHIKAYLHELKSIYKMPHPTKIMEQEEFKDIDFENDYKLPVVLGKSRAGYEILDVADAPQILFGGTTGSGKTNLFRVIALNLIYNKALFDKDVKLFIIDVKRNLGFLRQHAEFCFEYDHVEKTVNHIKKEMDKRYSYFDHIGIDDIEDIPAEEKSKFPRLVLMIDEFGGISPNLATGDEKARRRGIVYKIADIVNRGRGCGCHVIIGTQRPDKDTMETGDMKANTPVKLAFKTETPQDSGVILNNGMAYLIPEDMPGRSIIKGKGIQRQLQVYELNLKNARKMLPENVDTKPELQKSDRKDGEIDLGGN